MPVNSKVFGRANHVLWGLYVWEVISTLDLEWSLLTGKRKFKWPLVFYLVNRYIYLTAATLAIVLGDALANPTSCHYLFTTAIVLGYMAHAFSGINLAIRLIAIWAKQVILVAFLCAMITGYWVVVIVEGSRVSAEYVKNFGCVIKYNNFNSVATILTYSLCFDSIILGLSLYKLRIGMARMPRDALTFVVLKQGVMFFGTAVLVNLVTLIVLYKGTQTPGLPGICMVVSMMLCTIVACRAVRSLYERLRDPPQETHIVPSERSTIFHDLRRNSESFQLSKLNHLSDGNSAEHPLESAAPSERSRG